MKLLLPALALTAAGLTGCISTRTAPLPADGAAQVYFTRLPERPYRELAYVEATGNAFTTRPQLLRKLQQQQARLQGDALVQVRYDFVFWWPHAGAVVVKYQ
ncbi:hypothetical protein EJV47_19655 [Hymenobacter gummosus]|uniref:Uncharacterized protein n=1 Tax=Hymenobacter gummosus TaxID=1776032 RepID=A0A431TYV8_9BACT|nr:hypothetical protein [Hymenobacter gummosus]RTQ47115.1 hypothetical protein EJV47_19655 [Hymenobacter gummosus]